MTRNQYRNKGNKIKKISLKLLVITINKNKKIWRRFWNRNRSNFQVGAILFKNKTIRLLIKL